MHHHIVTTYYTPTEEAKRLYGSLKSENTDLMLMNAGSLRGSEDPWVKENVVFEEDFEDNISKMNPHFCELTSMYAAWKNLSKDWSQDDTVQHSHYRKTLDMYDCNPDIDGNPTIRTAPKYPMVFQTSRGQFRRCDIREGTLICHPRQSWEAMETVVMEFGSWRDNQDFDVWKKLPYMPAPINIWSMPVSKFREYCEWMFPRVMEIDRMIPYDAEEYRTAYQRRALSFIGERLFSFWAWSRDRRGELTAVPTHWTLHDGLKSITDWQERQMRI